MDPRPPDPFDLPNNPAAADSGQYSFSAAPFDDPCRRRHLGFRCPDCGALFALRELMLAHFVAASRC